MGRLRGSMICAAAALLAGAGRPAAVAAAVRYDVTLGAGVQATDNLHLDPDSPGEGQRQPVDEIVYTFSPAARLAWDAPRDRLNLAYRGEYWAFTGDEERDALWMHNLDAGLSWRRWSPFFLEVSEALSRVPRSQDREHESIVDQIDSSRLSIRTGVVREWGSRGAVELAYGHSLQTFPGTDDVDRTEHQFGEVLARYRWTPLWGGAVQLSYGRHDRALAPDATELGASATVDQRVSERFALHYRFEWIRDKEEDGPAGEGATPAESESAVRSTLLKGIELTGDLRVGGSWSLAYQDTLEYLADGDTLSTGLAAADVALFSRRGSSLRLGGRYAEREYRVSGREETAWGPTASARWAIAPWIAGDVASSWTSTALQRLGQARVDDRAVLASAGLIAMASPALTVEMRYDFRSNDSEDPSRSYTSNTASARVTYYFSRLVPGALPFPVGAASLDR